MEVLRADGGSFKDPAGQVYRIVRDAGKASIVRGLNPSAERPAFDARRNPDMVLCLALAHHLRVAANIPLRLFIGWLRSLDATCILEFVGRDDEMFQTLLENKREHYADYTAENFESEVRRCFSVRDRLKLKGGLRELFLLEPADGR